MKVEDKYRGQSEERITPYSYECKDCGYQEDLYYKMSDETRPLKYTCPKCNSEEGMFRIFGQPIHIPMDFGDGENKFDFSKSPSRRKHFF